MGSSLNDDTSCSSLEDSALNFDNSNHYCNNISSRHEEKKTENKKQERKENKQQEGEEQRKGNGRSYNIETKKRSSRSSRKRTVRFESSSSLTEVHKIKPLFKYHDDLWFSEQELEQNRLIQSDFSEAPDSVKVNVRSFINAYETGREQTEQKQKMTSPVFHELVLGLARGYSGMEVHYDTQVNICNHINATVQSIVASHKNATFEQQRTATLRSTAAKPALEAEIIVKAHSEALTAADHQWAVAMGKAERAAAKALARAA
jgi:hypothetical protein